MKINVNYYMLSPRRFIAGTKGSYGFETLEFVFDTHWQGLTKKVVFYPDGEPPVTVDIGEGPIAIPHEVMLHGRLTKYTVVGFGENSMLVSVSGGIDVLYSNPDIPASVSESNTSEAQVQSEEA